MKLLLSIATALLLATPAFAMDLQGLKLEIAPGSATAQRDQYYSFNFGTTHLRFPRYADFDLTNRGPGPLYIDQIATAGADFTAHFGCPRVLPPNTFCTIRVGFNPWYEGLKTGRLYILTHEGRIIIDLSGWAIR